MRSNSARPRARASASRSFVVVELAQTAGFVQYAEGFDDAWKAREEMRLQDGFAPASVRLSFRCGAAQRAHVVPAAEHDGDEELHQAAVGVGEAHACSPGAPTRRPIG